MIASSKTKLLPALLPALISLCVFSTPLRAENFRMGAADSKSNAPDVVGADEFLRSYLQMQSQLHDTQVAMQKIRQEAASNMASNSAAVEERLRAMEKAVDSQRSDLGNVARLERTMLTAAGAFAALGFVVLLLAAWLQWATVRRLQAAAAYPLAQLGPAGGGFPASPALEQSNARLLELMNRLEQRVQGLEIGGAPPKRLAPSAETEPLKETAVAPGSPSAPALAAPGDDRAGKVTVLVGKSQTFMKLDKPENALECLEEALVIDPANADALVKRGAALERLQRLPEAIESYDRAIAQDSSMIMAYLYKGSVFNRLERHDEALACYEQALKADKSGKGLAAAAAARLRRAPAPGAAPAQLTPV